MKKPRSIAPLQVNARIATDRKGVKRIEWSAPESGPDDDLSDDDHQHAAHSGVFQRVRTWIDERIGAGTPENRMLRRLHRSPKLEIILPENSQTTSTEIDSNLNQFWKEREIRHKRLTMLTAVLLIPATLLSVVPGPNLVGLGMTYVLWHHWQILRGLKRVRTGQLSVEIRDASSHHKDPDPENPSSVSNQQSDIP
jgi:hypothetical protein